LRKLLIYLRCHGPVAAHNIGLLAHVWQAICTSCIAASRALSHVLHPTTSITLALFMCVALLHVSLLADCCSAVSNGGARQQHQQQSLSPVQETTTGITLAVLTRGCIFCCLAFPLTAAALYHMEGLGSSSNSSSFPNTPHPSFQDATPPATAAAAAAAASVFRGTAALRSTVSSGSRTPYNAAAAAAAAAQDSAAASGNQLDQQQLLFALRERLNSFPLDNLSPTTTATALSLLSALAPAGNSQYGGDDEAAYALGPVSSQSCHGLSCVQSRVVASAPAGHSEHEGMMRLLMHLLIISDLVSYTRVRLLWLLLATRSIGQMMSLPMHFGR
jgi:hypothetical protein